MPSSVGPERKLARAYDHFKTLKRVTEGLEDDLSHEGRIQKRDADTGRYLWRVRPDRERLAEVSLLFGDFIHNLRATLDHIVWELTPPEQRERRPLPEFPIYLNPGPGGDGFHKTGILKIWSIPQDAKVVIEAMQPYNAPAGQKERSSPLWWIRELDNIDKHRAVIASAWMLSGGSVFIRDDEMLSVIVSLKVHRGRMNDSGVIAELDTSGGSSPEDVELNPTLEIYLTESGLPEAGLVATAHDLYYLVKNKVLPQFAPFFD